MAGVPTILVEAMHQTTHSHFITFVSFSLFSQDVVQYRFRRPRRPPRASQRLEGGYRTCVWPCHQVSCTVLSCFVSCYAWCWLKETWSSLVSCFLHAFHTYHGLRSVSSFPGFLGTCYVASWRQEAQVKNDRGNLPLHTAASFRAPLEVAEALLEAYPEAASITNNYGNLALHFTAWKKGPLDVEKLLLRIFPEGELLPISRCICSGIFVLVLFTCSFLSP